MFPMTTAYPPRPGRHQRPFNHSLAEGNTEYGGGGPLVADSCCMFNYPTATILTKSEKESITAYSVQVLPPPKRSSTLFPCRHLINTALMPLILWSTTIANNTVIVMTIKPTIFIILNPNMTDKTKSKATSCWWIQVQRATSSHSSGAVARPLSLFTVL